MECIGKYFLMEKMAFLSMTNIFFLEAEIHWNDNSSVNPQGVSLTLKNILTIMNRDVVLNLSTFQKTL